jgi:hypothetical protein
MEADIRVIVATLTGLVALATVSAQAVPSTKLGNWLPLDTPLSFALGDQACAYGWHPSLNKTLVLEIARWKKLAQAEARRLFVTSRSASISRL